MVLRRCFKVDEDAVSEVVGSILTLAITVVLFSSVFATVTQLEGPDEKYHVELKSDLDYHDSVHYVNITHEGGKELSTSGLRFTILIDGVGTGYDFDHDNVTLTGDDKSTWSIGEQISIEDRYELDMNSTMELVIQDKDTNRVVHKTVILEKGREVFEIRNSHIRYKESWRNYARPGEEIEIRTEVTPSIFKRNESFSHDDIWVNASIYKNDILVNEDWDPISSNEVINLTHLRSGIYHNLSLSVKAGAEHSSYRMKITAESKKASLELNTEPRYIYLNVGRDVKEFYEKKVEIGDFWLSPGDPAHGGPLTINAEVFNHGESDVKTDWKVEDDRQENFNGSITVNAGPAPTLLTAQYPNGALGHGPHEIMLKVDPTPDGWGEDNKTKMVTVDPSVMLVGDSIPDSQEETELMKNALNGLNYKYDSYSVDIGETIPELESKLINHSICIWMTGNRTEEADDLYINDDGGADDPVLTKLNDYVEGNLRDDRALNGTLWFLGSNLEKIENNNIAFGELQNKLGLDFNVPDGPFGDSGSFGNEKLLSPLVKDKNGTYGDFTYGVDEGEYVKIKEKKDGVEDNDILADEYTHYGLGYEKKYDDKNYTHKTVVNSFLFKSIADPGLRTIMAGEVIEWLSNMTTRQGTDISVVSQDITPKAAMYRKNVTITARLRNNGPEERSVRVRAIRDDGEEVLRPEGKERISLPGNGGTKIVTFKWYADELGKHEFLVKADYFNDIDEVNSRNNDITYKNLDVTSDTIEISVQFSTLLVDADGSSENKEVGREIKKSFDRLGYKNDSVGKITDYNYTEVKAGEVGPDYEGEGGMIEYNAVYWITGRRESETDEPLFTDEDIENILSYIDQDSGANMLFMGENILTSLSEGGLVPEERELIKHMGIDPDSTIEDTQSSTLIGQKRNDLSHNLKYDIEEKSYTRFGETTEGGEILFKNRKGDNLASMNDTGTSKTVYMGVGIDRIEGSLMGQDTFDDWPVGKVDAGNKSARDEFIYTSLWNYGKKEIRPRYQRPELRVTDYDVKISSKNPQTAGSYEIDVTIENIGYKDASVLVRIADGQNYVDSRNVRVGASTRTSEEGSTYFEVKPGSETIEVSWRPNHGGMRAIKVRVDPLDQREEIQNETGEEIMEFHNQAIIEHPVYYFYDDMENGEGKWRYDSTLMNIDGSSPLNFIGRKGLDTNVNGSWDSDLSGSTTADGTVYLNGNGIYESDNPAIGNFTGNASYSPPRSYWLPETPGDPEAKGRKPIDLVLLIDDGLAESNDLENATDAAKAAVNMLEPGDRIGVLRYATGGAPPHNVLSDLTGDEETLFFKIEDENDKSQVNSKIDGISGTSSRKNFFDALSWALYGLQEEKRENNVDVVEGIISFTDGVSDQDNQETGRFRYSKGGPDEPAEEGPVRRFKNGDGRGLLGIPYNIMTISISNTLNTRKHWISATSTGNFSYGILERDTKKLKDLYRLFVNQLQQSARGELKSIPIGEVGSDNTIFSNNMKDTQTEIKDTEFFVFEDAFTTGKLDPENIWQDSTLPGSGIPGHGYYDTFEFNPGYVERRTKKSGKPTDWIYIKSENTDEKISKTVDPRETLDKLNGEYTVKNAYANFLLETQNNAELKLKINGQTVRSGLASSGEYFNVSTGLNNAEPFKFEFIHSGSGGDLWLDDISFTYEIDYYPSEQEYAQNIAQNRTYRYLTTPSADLGEMENLNSATLQFRHKYKSTQGATGGFIYLWGKQNNEDWTWNKTRRLYVEPEQSYTGNLNLDRVEEQKNTGGVNITGNNDGLIDANGNLPYWVFNGKSQDGTFGWRYTEVELTRYKDFIKNFDKVKAVFTYAQLGGITREQGWEPPMGWYIDNVKFKVSSEWDSNGPNYWNYTNATQLEDMGIDIDDNDLDNYTDHTYGTEDGHYWIFTTNNGGRDALPKGVDSSLYTEPIYLDNAEDPRLTAYMKFNLHDDAGLPPDGFRVEVSSDNGRTWNSITYGARAAWNASGTDKKSGEAYSGTTADDDSKYGWVNSNSLYRLNADLSGWRGESIILRFRVFTNTTTEYDESDLPKAIFIDDVMVTEGKMGNSNTVLNTEEMKSRSFEVDRSEERHVKKESNPSGTFEDLYEKYPSYTDQIIDEEESLRYLLGTFYTGATPEMTTRFSKND